MAQNRALVDINAEVADYLESKSSIADAALSFVGHGPTQTAVADWDAEAATYGVILRFSESDSVAASLLGFAASDLTYEISEGGKHKYFKALLLLISTPSRSIGSSAVC